MVHGPETKSRIETTGPVQPCACIAGQRTRSDRAADMAMATPFAASAYSHDGLSVFRLAVAVLYLHFLLYYPDFPAFVGAESSRASGYYQL